LLLSASPSPSSSSSSSGSQGYESLVGPFRPHPPHCLFENVPPIICTWDLQVFLIVSEVCFYGFCRHLKQVVLYVVSQYSSRTRHCEIAVAAVENCFSAVHDRGKSRKRKRSCALSILARAAPPTSYMSLIRLFRSELHDEVHINK
jgi:hypothetical protein